ncbi:MAG: hypothetical protein ACEY26_00505 [Candidatus Hodgkinia cicadicola]
MRIVGNLTTKLASQVTTTIEWFNWPKVGKWLPIEVRLYPIGSFTFNWSAAYGEVPSKCANVTGNANCLNALRRLR